MPVDPALQFFSNTGLSQNPFLSSILFFRQRQIDEQNRVRDEEQRQFENERETERIQLAKDELANRSAQLEATLAQKDIENRVNAFKFRYGAENVPEALILGSMEAPVINDPVSHALSMMDRTGNVDPEIDVISDLNVENPISGKMETFDEPTIESILRGEERRQEQKMAIPRMQMEMSMRRFALGQLAQNERARQANDVRKQIHDDVMKERRADRASREGIAAKRTTGQGSESFSNLGPVADSGTRPTGNIVTDQPFWNSLTGTDRAVLGGIQDASKVMNEKELREFTNKASKSGLVVPNFNVEDVGKYKEQKNAAVSMLRLAQQFSDELEKGGTITGVLPEGIAGKLTEKEAKARNHQSYVFYKQMNGFVESLKGLTGATGVLTNQDVEAIRGLLPNYEMNAEQRKNQIKLVMQYIQGKENTFFSAIPKAQREFIFASNGIEGSMSVSGEVDPIDSALREYEK